MALDRKWDFAPWGNACSTVSFIFFTIGFSTLFDCWKMQGAPFSSQFSPHQFLNFASLLQPGRVQELATALTLAHATGTHKTLPGAENLVPRRGRLNAPPRHNSDSNTMLEAASQLSGEKVGTHNTGRSNC